MKISMSKTICKTVLLFAIPGSIAFSAPVSGTKQNPANQTTPLIVGAKLGLANVESISDQTFAYGASVHFPMDPTIQVGATIDYWNKSSLGIQEKQVQIDDLSFGGHARFMFKPGAALQPFAVAGLAVHRFSVSIAEATDSEDPQIDRFRKVGDDVAGKLGIDLGGGANYGIQRNLDANGEILWRKLADSSVNFDQLVFSAGLSYRL
jgi:opacity protein-like surface antigen